MPNNSVFDGLSPAEIAKIEGEIANRNFKGYTELSDWCKSHGWEIERGALWTRGSKLKKRLQSLKNATDAAKMFGESAKDDEGALNDATLSLVQAGLFDVLANMADAEEEEDPAKRIDLLGKAARAAADVGRASISTKKYRQEVREKTQAAADKISQMAKKGGLSPESVESIRKEILGIAS